MKQFLNYFKALNYAPKPKSVQFLPIIVSACLIYFNFIFVIIESHNAWAIAFSWLCSFALLSGVILSNYLNNSPNLYSLIPVSSKKSLLYRYLSVLFMFVLMVLIALFVFAVIFLIGFLFSLIPACNGDVEAGEVVNAVEEIYYPVGAYGGLFFVAYFIIMYSAGMITGLFKTRKWRNVFVLCFGVFIFIAVMATAFSSDFISPFVNACFEAMALPWLCIAFWFVVAAAMLGIAIYMGIKRYNPKKF